MTGRKDRMKQVRRSKELSPVQKSEHRIMLEGVSNARELGGYPNSDGKILRSGLLIRSGGLDAATDKDVMLLSEKYRVRVIIDLRSVRESTEYPDAVIAGAEYHNLPVLVSKIPGDEFSLSRSELYAEIMFGELAKQAYQKFFSILLNSGSSAVLFHDTCGSDQTGVAAALLLSILGFPEELITEEYMLSNKAYISDLSVYARSFVKVQEHLLGYALMKAKVEYGSVESYIRRELQVSESDVRQLRHHYLTNK